MPEGSVSDAKKLGAQGGKARAAKLSKTELSEIGKRGALARWPIPEAKYQGELQIGDAIMPCAVLEDETRVLTQGEVLEALGRHRKANVRNVKGEEPTPPILQGERLKPFISAELLEKSKPIKFRTLSGSIASGYRAEILPMVCEVYLKARDARALAKQQFHIAVQSEVLVRGLAATGIIALVDEATGFQAVRDQDALSKFLSAYVAKELRQWVSTFPRSFFQQICRLKGVPFPEDMRLPQYFGHIVNDLVYDRLAPGVREELQRVNPVVGPKGRRKTKHFQWLTENIGNPKLLHHLGKLDGLAHGFADGDWENYYQAVCRVLPKDHGPLFAQAVADRKRLGPPTSAQI